MSIVLPCSNYFWAWYYYAGLCLYHTIFKFGSDKSYKFPFKSPKILNRKDL